MTLLAFAPRPTTDLRILREQLHIQNQTLPMSMGGSFFIVVLWAIVISFWIPLFTVIWWSMAMMLQFALWYYGATRYRERVKNGAISDRAVLRMARLSVWGSLVSGCLWGVSSIVFFPSPGSVHVEYQYLLMLTLAGLISGAAFAQGSYLPAFYAFAIPSAAPVIILLMSQGILIQAMFGFSAIFYLLMIARMAMVLNQTLVNSFQIRFANEDLADRIAQQHQTVLDASSAKSKFLASASHDLRQPLHAMEMFVEAIRQCDLDDTPRRITEKLRGSTAAMRELLDALLDISKLDAGVIVPKPDTVDLHRLIKLVCDEFRPSAQAKGLSLRVKVPEHTATQSDPALLKSILSNLVGNAIRYSDHGGVLVTCRSAGANWLLDVHDTGHGIASAQRQEIFKEFVQLHNPQRDRAQGLGLGLAIVRRLADLLGHKVELESTVNRGSRFRIHVAKQLWRPAATTAPMMSSSSLEQGALVVIVDDELSVREAMEMMLETWGLRTSSHPDAASALLALADEPLIPLLLVCDYRLAGATNGIQVIEKIRSEYNVDSELPALLMTGDTGTADLQVAKNSGIRVMHKPVETDQLRAYLEQLSLERRVSAAPTGADE